METKNVKTTAGDAWFNFIERLIDISDGGPFQRIVGWVATPVFLFLLKDKIMATKMFATLQISAVPMVEGDILDKITAIAIGAGLLLIAEAVISEFVRRVVTTFALLDTAIEDTAEVELPDILKSIIAVFTCTIGKAITSLIQFAFAAGGGAGISTLLIMKIFKWTRIYSFYFTENNTAEIGIIIGMGIWIWCVVSSIKEDCEMLKSGKTI